MAKSSLGRSDRFYKNPVLRDEEWFTATQAPWWLLTVAVLIVAGGFFCGVYAERPYNYMGWTAGVGMIVVYLVLGSARRRRARQRLRDLHGQAT
jgi:hypothetical protein